MTRGRRDLYSGGKDLYFGGKDLYFGVEVWRFFSELLTRVGLRTPIFGPGSLITLTTLTTLRGVRGVRGGGEPSALLRGSPKGTAQNRDACPTLCATF